MLHFSDELNLIYFRRIIILKNGNLIGKYKSYKLIITNQDSFSLCNYNFTKKLR